MDHSPEIGALAEALAKAQAAIQNPTKNREVEVKLRDNAGKYKFKYATFDGIIDALRPHLTANGIWFIQAIVSGNMVTRITHSSGQWLDSVVPMPNLTGKPQEIGSLITYFKRYGLSAAFGVAVDEDDDANAAEGNSVEFKSSAAKPKPVAVEDEVGRRPKLQGFHKTRAALQQATRNLANDLSEAADGGDMTFIDEVLTTHFETIQQLEQEGADWWDHPDYGIKLQIERAKEKVNG